MTHTHYKGTGKIHSFRGLLAHGEQDKIGIQGSVGAVAWRIVKFGLMPNTPGGDNSEFIGKIYREEQSAVNATVDFNDTELLAAGYINNHTGAAYYNLAHVIVFDNALFTRNIFATMHDNDGNDNSCNYYIELEEVKVGKAGMAQLSLAASRRMQSDV